MSTVSYTIDLFVTNGLALIYNTWFFLCVMYLMFMYIHSIYIIHYVFIDKLKRNQIRLFLESLKNFDISLKVNIYIR